MYKDFMGIINLDENENDIKQLAKGRSLSSIPIGGRYRIIDFILSNMANSGVENIGIFSKMESRSLIDHLNNGKPWDLDRKIDGLRIFNFTDRNPSLDDVHSFFQNVDYIKKSREKYVIMASSQMICNMDFNKIMEYHMNSHNDVTTVYKVIDHWNSNYSNCETLNIDSDGMVLDAGKNIGIKEKLNINMGIYIMKKDTFMDIVYKCVRTESYKKIKNYIWSHLCDLKVGSTEFNGYLSCINSVESYYRTNMDFLDNRVMRELFSKNRPIYTKTNDEIPAKYSSSSCVKNSIVGNGCVIYGTVENSIVSRKVEIGKGAVIKNCVILPNCIIGNNVKINGIILNKGCIIKPESEFRCYKNNHVVIGNVKNIC